jgi:hypothetical protein
VAITEEAGAVPAAAGVQADGELRPPGSVKFFYSVGQVVESGYLAVNAFRT